MTTILISCLIAITLGHMQPASRPDQGRLGAAEHDAPTAVLTQESPMTMSKEWKECIRNARRKTTSPSSKLRRSQCQWLML
jgi:hypothetical protein